MIEDSCTVTLWCDTTTERCRTSATFKGPTRFDAINAARAEKWYVQSRSFCLCPVHDNVRTLELIEHEKRTSAAINQRNANAVQS